MTGQKVGIRLKAYDHRVIDQSAEKIVGIARRSGTDISGPTLLPIEKSIYIIIRAVHRHKDLYGQSERRTYKHLVDIVDPIPETVDVLISLSLPSGIDIEIES